MKVTPMGDPRQTSGDNPPQLTASTIRKAVDALNTQDSFTRTELAWFMQQAYRWGYEARDDEDRGFWAGYNARVDEENATTSDTSLVFDGKSTTDWMRRKSVRDEWDAAARLPRPGDFKGIDCQQVAA